MVASSNVQGPDAMSELREIIVIVKSNTSRRCPVDDCDELLDGLKRFEEACNHLIVAHGLTCVHVGTETDQGDDGPLHITVAVFGR